MTSEPDVAFRGLILSLMSAGLLLLGCGSSGGGQQQDGGVGGRASGTGGGGGMGGIAASGGSAAGGAPGSAGASAGAGAGGAMATGGSGTGGVAAPGGSGGGGATGTGGNGGGAAASGGRAGASGGGTGGGGGGGGGNAPGGATGTGGAAGGGGAGGGGVGGGGAGPGGAGGMAGAGGIAGMAGDLGGNGGAGGAACTSIKINEVLVATSTSADEEFIELYNPCSTVIDLAGFRLVYRAVTGVIDTNVATFTNQTIAAGAFFVVGSYIANGRRDLSFALNVHLAGAGGVGIRNAANALLDAVAYAPVGTLVNNGLVEGGLPATAPLAGQSIVRRPNGRDTNTNAGDFAVTPIPSPGATNN